MKNSTKNRMLILCSCVVALIRYEGIETEFNCFALVIHPFDFSKLKIEFHFLFFLFNQSKTLSTWFFLFYFFIAISFIILSAMNAHLLHFDELIFNHFRKKTIKIDQHQNHRQTDSKYFRIKKKTHTESGEWLHLKTTKLGKALSFG